MEQEKTKMEAMLRSILDEILESKLTAILSSILDAKLKTYEESMNFYNTKLETMKGKIRRFGRTSEDFSSRKRAPEK